MARARKFTPAAMERVIGALRAGAGHALAAQVIGASRQGLEKHLKNHPADAKRVEEAKAWACDAVERALWRAAVEGGSVTAMIFWLKNRRPDRWRDVWNLDHGGKVTVTIKRAE